MPGTKMHYLVFLLLFAAVQRDPFLDGLSHFKKGEYAAAESAFQEAVATQQEPRARSFLALARAANGKCDAALADLSAEYAKTSDLSLRRLLGLGLVQCYISGNRPLDALSVLLKLKVQYPSDADILYRIAQLYSQAWNQTIREIFRETPSSFRVNQLSGEIFVTEGKYTEACEEFRKAISKAPNTLELHFELGRALLMSAHTAAALSQAEGEFEAELKLNSKDPAAEFELAQILLTKQSRGAGLQHLQRAVDLDPNFTDALISLGRAKLEDKDYNAAIALLDRAVQVQPGNEAAHYSLMMAYRNAGRAQDAVREQSELEKLQAAPNGEFRNFLRKLGEKAPHP
jgi:predicted Zn-dependent protease